MAILKKTIIFLLPILLTGCYSDFDPEIDIKPVLCLNSLIQAGERINVEVSHTWLYTDVKAQKDHSVKDAEISVIVNGVPVDTATYLPKEGDRIRIEAVSPAYGSAEAEVTVPYMIPATDIEYDITLRSIHTDHREGWGLTGSMMFDINAAIDMPASRDKDHYYRLSYRSFMEASDEPDIWEEPDEWEDPEGEYSEYRGQNFSTGYFRTMDPIFSEYVSDFEDMMGYGNINAFFADRSFEGSSRKVRFWFEGCGFSFSGWNPDSGIMPCGYTVTLHTISKSYFDWAMYYWNSERGMIGEFSDMGLAEPIWGYSNVSTGAGVVAAQSSTTVTIDIRDFLEKNLLRSPK